jgi:thiol-disulfide isomerase/thioredoxin
MGLLKISVVTCGILLSFLGVCRSDTIQLRSGKEVQATVSKYKNNVFEARSADGKTTSYPANEVSRIQLTVTQSAGTRTFPAIFIDRVDFVADKGQNIELIARGQQVDIKKHLALGNVTIIDFYAEWCGPCKMISPMLEHLAQTDPEIALRKIDIVTWQSPVARQYNVEGVPRVEVYGRKGQLIGAMQGVNPDGVLKLVAKAKGG